MIRRKPRLAQRSPSAGGSEPGLNTNKTHHFMPVLAPVTTVNTTGKPIPSHRYRVGLSVFTSIPQTLSRNRNKPEDKTRDADEETEDQDC